MFVSGAVTQGEDQLDFAAGSAEAARDFRGRLALVGQRVDLLMVRAIAAGESFDGRSGSRNTGSSREAAGWHRGRCRSLCLARDGLGRLFGDPFRTSGQALSPRRSPGRGPRAFRSASSISRCSFWLRVSSWDEICRAICDSSTSRFSHLPFDATLLGQAGVFGGAGERVFFPHRRAEDDVDHRRHGHAAQHPFQGRIGERACP